MFDLIGILDVLTLVSDSPLTISWSFCRVNFWLMFSPQTHTQSVKPWEWRGCHRSRRCEARDYFTYLVHTSLPSPTALTMDDLSGLSNYRSDSYRPVRENGSSGNSNNSNNGKTPQLSRLSMLVSSHTPISMSSV